MRWLLFAIVLSAQAATYFTGYNRGHEKAQLDNSLAELQVIDLLLERGQRQFDAANETSQKILGQMQERARQDQKTTQELRHALAKTADSRAECRIPAELMHYLDQAQAAAAKATTSRLDAAMPSAGAVD